ncbi:MAG: cytochrome c biogenesis protein, partial [Dehalococcoidia bacterium]|nr:cytochrome c biogenesis protein [Dehalococcoidia bacterium]
MASSQSMERTGGLQFPSLKTMLAVITGVMMLVDLYFIFMVAPTDAVIGHVQRVFYFHVPIAIMSFLAFFVVFIASLMYLFKRSPKWDAFAHASAEVGVVFVTLALISGIIWARPVWNTWWTWEPRLTTTLILWLIYVAYLMVR